MQTETVIIDLTYYDVSLPKAHDELWACFSPCAGVSRLVLLRSSSVPWLTVLSSAPSQPQHWPTEKQTLQL